MKDILKHAAGTALGIICVSALALWTDARQSEAFRKSFNDAYDDMMRRGAR